MDVIKNNKGVCASYVVTPELRPYYDVMYLIVKLAMFTYENAEKHDIE